MLTDRGCIHRVTSAAAVLERSKFTRTHQLRTRIFQIPRYTVMHFRSGALQYSQKILYLTSLLQQVSPSEDQADSSSASSGDSSAESSDVKADSNIASSGNHGFLPQSQTEEASTCCQPQCEGTFSMVRHRKLDSGWYLQHKIPYRTQRAHLDARRLWNLCVWCSSV